MCSGQQIYLITKRAVRVPERAVVTPNGGFSGTESEKLSPLSSEWGASGQPEALGPGSAPPDFIRVTYHMAQ